MAMMSLLLKFGTLGMMMISAVASTRMKPLSSELAQLMPRECPRYATFGAAQGLSTLYLGKGNNKSRQVEQLIEEMMGLVVGAKPKCAAKDIYLHCEDGDHRALKRTALEERAQPSCDNQYPYKTQCAISKCYR
ncbi:MAG: hypothetical protein Q9174_000368 [Haloplaca sp. 1 TL-2023]